ncbi:anthranilate synthase component 1 [Frondihabitans sp. PhB188]|uniref:anthranilate synthase component I family protein n=1 Tax=Frondihabitans sp. PhB188 TaxID=2485200 RepID=UPI000F46E9D6|nr:anthranilate synthase component I family protein [Frondihabitans sp. PhB188]ROQ41214.1 anthranilate synthase component 1 [Frondihabitans sp. PhB188]
MRQPPTRTPLAGWVTPEAVVRAFGAEGDVVWIDAGAAADAEGAAPSPGHPARSLVGWGRRRLDARAAVPGDVEAALARVDASLRDDDPDADPLGWWGVVGYGVSAELLAPGDATWAGTLGDPVRPDLLLLEVDRALVFDHGTGLVELVERGAEPELGEALRNWWPGREPRQKAVPAPGATAAWADDDARYLDLIAGCLAAIDRGDAFVICLTTSASVVTGESDLDLYARLRRSSPAPRASFIRLGETAVLGASPEEFLRIDAEGRVSTSPIKGTRERSADSRLDEARAQELASNRKERAENLMIVDLMRNDLSRVSRPEHVAVSSLFAVEGFEHVHQLVSTVTAVVRPGLTGIDVLRATFPPGSMTGAPKHSVVRILAGLEAGPRGLYSGVAGRFGFDGTVDLAVVIRSIVLDLPTGEAGVGVGGGITNESDPADELAEVAIKARALLTALGASGVPDSLI